MFWRRESGDVDIVGVVVGAKKGEEISWGELKGAVG